MEYFIEKERVQNSREGKAYESLSDSINSTTWNPVDFAKAAMYDHPTLQQSLIRTMVATINEFAKKEYTDARNEAGVQMCRNLVKSGLLYDFLPFI